MAQHTVTSRGYLTVSAEHAWSLVSDFCTPWHPAIATMTTAYDNAGRQIRTFTVIGDDHTYQERLTWFSNSERSMAYTHVAGIDGVENYNARLFIEENEDGNSTATMSATLNADEPRASDIASGTQAIFDDGIKALQSLVQSTPAAPEVASPPLDHTTPLNKTLSDKPAIAVSYTTGLNPTNDTLCLFLHGIGGNRSNWDTQLSAVAPYCTAVSMDLRGYGDSDLGETPSTIDDYCNDILRVAQSFNAKKIMLCGLSYGAWIATSFAMRYPDQLAALVLSGGCTGMSEAGTDEREAFRRSREEPLNAGQTPADFAPAVVEILAGPDITDAVKDQLMSSMQAITAKTYADALRCFTSPTETFDFAKLDLPVLLMTGEADKLAPPHEIKKVAQRIHQASAIPDVRYECLSRAGHLCNLEAPINYNKPLIELIQRVL